MQRLRSTVQSSRESELHERCATLSQELATVRAENATLVDSLQKQLKEARDESDRIEQALKWDVEQLHKVSVQSSA